LFKKKIMTIGKYFILQTNIT